MDYSGPTQVNFILNEHIIDLIMMDTNLFKMML